MRLRSQPAMTESLNAVPPAPVLVLFVLLLLAGTFFWTCPGFAQDKGLVFLASAPWLPVEGARAR